MVRRIIEIDKAKCNGCGNGNAEQGEEVTF